MQQETAGPHDDEVIMLIWGETDLATGDGGNDMARGLGEWTMERVGDRVRGMADNVRGIADSLQRTQMPAMRKAWTRLPEVRLPEVRSRPERRGAHPAWIVIGAAAGAGLMYFLDREHGQRRRQFVRDKARTFLRHTSEAVDGTSRDVMSRARGLVVDLRSKVGPQERREPWAPEASSEARRS